MRNALYKGDQAAAIRSRLTKSFNLHAPAKCEPFKSTQNLLSTESPIIRML
jgi:hypothetical protein